MDKRILQLLISADNISPRYLEVILAEASKYGEIGEKRIYGDWVGSNKRPWKELLTRNSIVPVQQCGAESVITMDALDMVDADGVDGLILASYDSDFTKLALKLKAGGKTVIGMGDAITPTAYINACDAFVFLDVIPRNGMTNSPSRADSPVVFQRKEADGSVSVDGSGVNSECTAAGGSGISSECTATDGSSEDGNSAMCAAASRTEASGKKAMAEEDTRADAEKTTEETVEKSLTVGIKDIKKFIFELLEQEENDGKILLEKLALLLKQRFPLFSHKKFGYSKFPQFIESIPDLQVMSATPRYELDQPPVYVIRSRDVNSFVNWETDNSQELEMAKPAWSLEEIEEAVIEIIESEEYNGIASLGAVRYLLKSKYPEFDQRMYGRAKFNKFMELLPGVQMVLEQVEGENQVPRIFVRKKQ